MESAVRGVEYVCFVCRWCMSPNVFISRILSCYSCLSMCALSCIQLCRRCRYVSKNRFCIYWQPWRCFSHINTVPASNILGSDSYFKTVLQCHQRITQSSVWPWCFWSDFLYVFSIYWCWFSPFPLFHCQSAWCALLCKCWPYSRYGAIFTWRALVQCVWLILVPPAVVRALHGLSFLIVL